MGRKEATIRTYWGQSEQAREQGDMPEKALLRAALQKAFYDIAATVEGPREAAMSWFRSSSRDHLFAFERVCEVLELLADPLRQKAEEVYLTRSLDLPSE